jgi:hypothetical protein
MFGTIGAVSIVGVNDCLGIAVCVKGVTEFFEFLAQLAVVIDFAVENYPGGAVLVVNRLLSALKIDDGQPAHTQANRSIEVEPVVVRAPMTNGFAHPSQQSFVNVSSITPNDSCYTTHELSALKSERFRF